MNFSRLQIKRLALTLALVVPTFVVGSTHLTVANADRSIGEEIFRNRCVMCHGLDGGGDTTLGKKLLIPDLRSDKVQRLGDDRLLQIITDGRGEMPAFKKKLSRDGIYQLIIHLRKLGKLN